VTNPATTADLESRWRPLSSQETLNGETFLDDAWRMLQRRIPDLQTKVTANVDDFAGSVVQVLATAVLRVMKNPDGKRQEAIDDYSWTRDQAISAGLLYFTDEELDDLNPGSGVKGRAYTVDPLAGYPDDRFSA
jgi:hypothetical protein